MRMGQMWPVAAARWIWAERDLRGKNQYAEFRRVFTVQRAVRNCALLAAADSNYEVWLDGQWLPGGQWSNWEQDRTYNRHELGRLQAGRHVLAVRVFHAGKSFFTYAQGQPGLIAAVVDGQDRPLCVTDETWRWRQSPSYRSGSVPVVTSQLGFTISYDAQGEDGWTAAGYDDAAWGGATALAGPTDGYWRTLRARPVPLLTVGPPLAATATAWGGLRRLRSDAKVAETMTLDQLSPAGLNLSYPGHGPGVAADPMTLPRADGQPLVLTPGKRDEGAYLVFDLGAEQAGLLALDIDAPAGTLLDIGHGEHLEDLRVRTAVGGRNFADRYVCRGGRQQWRQAFRRLGARYVQVHLPRLPGEVRIYGVTVLPTEYPFEPRGDFSSGDTLLDDVWRLGRRTMALCAHEHYEDCPWREQALYGYDSRLQALYGYYTFGETRLPAACWSLLGGGLRDDGLLEITAPTRSPLTIPGFSLHWISAVGELYLFSGRLNLVRDQYPCIRRILDEALQRMNADGVVANSAGENHWHFYEWTAGLDGNVEAVLKGQSPRGLAFDAVYNLLLLEALEQAAFLGAALGDDDATAYGRAAERIRRAFAGVFWDDRRSRYASFRRGENVFHYAQLTQALALRAGLVTDQRRARMLRRALLDDDTLTAAELPSKWFVYEALLAGGQGYTNAVLDDIRAIFGGMLKAGATSLWEHKDGAGAFGRAGSLCHAWSAVLNAVGGARILGVWPLKPGFERFAVAPLPGDLSRAEGVVPTPRGAIRVSWQAQNKELRLRLRHPKALTPEVQAPRGWRLDML